MIADNTTSIKSFLSHLKKILLIDCQNYLYLILFVKLLPVSSINNSFKLFDSILNGKLPFYWSIV